LFFILSDHIVARYAKGDDPSFLMNEINAAKQTPLSGDQLLKILEALANPHRLKIIALLKGRRVHVSQLAREAQISRPLLYMHLKRLQEAGLVTSKMELSEDGKAMNYFELVTFLIKLSPTSIFEAVDTLTYKKPSESEHENGKEDK